MQLKIDEKIFDHIKRMARYQAVEQDEDIGWQDLVRDAIYNSFPLPKENEKQEDCS